MATSFTPADRRRRRLTRDGIVAAAITIADAEGLDAVSMRRLGQEFDVDPMSLYRHVGRKDELLNAMTGAVVAQIEPVTDAGSWQASARATILAARATMLDHPWVAAIRRTSADPTPAELRYLNTLLTILRDAGLSVELTHHAIHALGTRLLGISPDLYDDSGETTPDEAQATAHSLRAAGLPVLAEIAGSATHDGKLGGCDDNAEFAFSLDLILDGLARVHSTTPG